MLRSYGRIIILITALVLIGVVIWIDVTTTIWQELVILSGLAAGLVTFLLTSLFIDRIIHRSTQRHWAPVTRLALTEILHQLADETRSELSLGQVVPRQLPTIEPSAERQALQADTADLRTVVVQERSRVATVLGTWWSFLSSASDSDDVVRHIADVALLFDHVRDASLKFDEALSTTTQPLTDAGARDALAALNSKILTCNHSIAQIVVEIPVRLAGDSLTLSKEAQQSLARLHSSLRHPQNRQTDTSAE